MLDNNNNPSVFALSFMQHKKPCAISESSTSGIYEKHDTYYKGSNLAIFQYHSTKQHPLQTIRKKQKIFLCFKSLKSCQATQGLCFSLAIK